MICKKCNGKGYIYTNAFGTKGILRCDVCGGNGKILSNQQTNEEWLRTLNTEQLAEWINNIVDDGIIKAWMIKNNCCGDYLESVKWWLKQPHTVKE